jgi:hypothetical protein
MNVISDSSICPSLFKNQSKTNSKVLVIGDGYASIQSFTANSVAELYIKSVTKNDSFVGNSATGNFPDFINSVVCRCSNRQKVVDRIYNGDLHSGYTRRYRNDDGKTNLKTLLSCKSKSERFFRKVTNKVKFFGIPFDCFNEVDILDTIGVE